MFKLPTEKGLYAPVGGWIPHAYYLVEMSVTANNPTFRCLLYTGFIGVCGEPEGYSGFITHAGSDGDSGIHLGKVYYMKPLHLMCKQVDLRLEYVAATAWPIKVKPFVVVPAWERRKQEDRYWKMHYAGDDEKMCVWPDDTYCLMEDLEEYLNPPCAMSDDYEVIHVDDKRAKALIGE